MTKDEAKKHFGLKPCPNQFYEFIFFGFLIHIQFAEDVWTKLDSEFRLNKHFLLIGSVEDVNGSKLWRIIFWKLSITIGNMSQ